MIFTISLFTFAFFTSRVFAANVEVVGKVNTNGQVNFRNVVSHKLISSIIDASGVYAIFLPPGTYDISFIPSQGSNIPEVTKNNVLISTNAVENITVPIADYGVHSGHSQANTWFIITIICGVILLTIFIGIYFLLRKNAQK